MQLDLARRFEDYCFYYPLNRMHSHNAVVNRLKLLPCRSVAKTDYLNVITDFQLGIADRFQHFPALYPNVRHVLIRSESWGQ